MGVVRCVLLICMVPVSWLLAVGGCAYSGFVVWVFMWSLQVWCLVSLLQGWLIKLAVLGFLLVRLGFRV